MRAAFCVLFLITIAFAGCLQDSDATREAQEAKRAGGKAPGTDVSAQAPLVPFPTKMSWERIADASMPRAEHCAANIGAKFYVVGGYIVPNPASAPGPAGSVPTAVPTDMVEIYDAESNTWTDGPTFPAQVNHCMAVGVGDSIYVIAGGSSSKIKVADASWSTIPAPPNSHGATGVAEEHDGKIYVVGGSGGGSNTVDVYDPLANAWTSFENLMPTTRNHMAGAIVNGKIYAIGGDIGGHSRNTGANEEFDILSGQWTNKTALPVIRGSLHAFAWFGRVVVMGGQNGATNVAAFADMQAYDPVSDAWTKLPDAPSPRHGFAGGVYNDKIYVFMGAPQQGVSATVQSDVLVPG